MKVILHELFGEYCLTKEQGRKLNIILESTIKLKETVTLDFFKIRLLGGDFIEGAFSKLFTKYKKSIIISRLVLKSIKPDMEKSLKFNIEFLDKYNNDDNYKHLIDMYFNPKENPSTIKDLEVLPIEFEENETKINTEKPVYIIERMDVQPDDRSITCGSNLST